MIRLPYPSLLFGPVLLRPVLLRPVLLRPLLFCPVLLLCAGLLGGCRGDGETGNSALSLTLAISPTPPAVGPARIIITLEDSTGAPQDGAEVVVEGNMSHAGMVPVIDTARAEGPGTYGIPDFGFTMAGDWILTFQATLPDGRTARGQRATNVVGSMGHGG